MQQGITVGQLARRSGLSRATLLYYDRLGLLRPSAPPAVRSVRTAPPP